eukprot:2049751-Amphidinium_carterae.2
METSPLQQPQLLHKDLSLALAMRHASKEKPRIQITAGFRGGLALTAIPGYCRGDTESLCAEGLWHLKLSAAAHSGDSSSDC